MSSDTRKLAAIMFTDVVGYSTMTNLNEALSLELLKEHQAILRSILARFRGREVDTAGDGFVVEFSSTEDSLECALEIQRTFADRNRTSPAERRLRLRIGIHVGDVVEFADEQKKGIYGNGVNVAARLQPLASPGGICISRAVYEQVHRKPDCEIRSMGQKNLRGIQKPVEVFSVVLSGDQHREPARPRIGFTVAGAVAIFAILFAFLWVERSRLENGPAARMMSLTQSSRMAVMPLDAVGLKPDEEYLADGLMDGLISSLSQKGFHVLAKDSVTELRKAHKSPREIGRELHIGRLLTGSLLASGGTVQASLSLIDTASEEVVWSHSYRQSSPDLFALQDEIASAIDRQDAHVTSSASVAAPGHAPRKEAYLEYLKGQYFFSKRTKDGYHRATEHFERAVTLDPEFALAFAALSNVADLGLYYGVLPPVEAALRMVKNANRAFELDPNLTEALLAQAEVKYYVEFDHEKADELFRRAIASNPRQPTAHQWYAEFLAYRQRFKEAFREADLSVDLDPLGLAANVAKGVMRYYAREPDEAITIFKQVLEMDPEFMLAHFWLGRALLEKHDATAAIASLEKATSLSGNEPMMMSALIAAEAAAGQTDRARTLTRELEATAKERSVSPYFLAIAKAALGGKTIDEAFALLHRGVEGYETQNAFIAVDPLLDPLRKDPRFKDILAAIRPRSL